MKYTIKKSTTLLEALEFFYPDSSRTTLRSWLKEGRVFLDTKKIIQASTPVISGQIIEVRQKTFTLFKNLHILYEDSDIVVVDKPPGLLSVATKTETNETAHQYLKDYFINKKVFPVHRLDQETSGVMVFALNERARDKLKDIFEKHTIDRTYIAAVEGSFKETSGTWESYLFEDANYYVHTTNNADKGKLAITHFTCKQAKKKYSLLELRLETGRKNQIRVQCKDAGYPVAGDTKYGALTNPIKRLALHAHSLGLIHPSKGKKMLFEVPVPKSFTQLFY